MREFPFQAVVVVRPSLLLGDREESRPGERVTVAVMRPLAPLMIGPLARYRPVHPRDVAATLVRAAVEGRPGVHVIESGRLGRAGRIGVSR